MLTELSKDESIAFLSVVTEFINVDNNINVEEKEILQKYIEKLNITKDEVKSLAVDEAINILEKASDRVKQIIYFELLGIALIDGEYENSEVDFLENISEKFDISRAKKISFANYYFDFENLKELDQAARLERIKSLLD